MTSYKRTIAMVNNPNEQHQRSISLRKTLAVLGTSLYFLLGLWVCFFPLLEALRSLDLNAEITRNIVLVLLMLLLGWGAGHLWQILSGEPIGLVSKRVLLLTPPILLLVLLTFLKFVLAPVLYQLFPG